MQQWLQDNAFQLITTIFGGGSFAAYILERKKRKIEEKQLTTDALKSMQQAYDTFTEHSNKMYNELSSMYDKLAEKYTELELKYNQVQKELFHLKKLD